MRNPLSKTITTIEPSGIRKFFDIVSEMEDAISLGVGEPDFDTPWKVRDEAIYSLEQGRTFYTSNAGLKELKVEIANYLNRRFGLHYDYAKEMLVTVGGSEAIDIALRAMLDPGDEVLIPQPSYVSYLPCTVLAGGTPVVINLKEENQFRLTAEELEAAITDKTKILIMPFPNNPTGAVMEKSDLEAVAKVVIDHDLFVLSDEIYAELTYLENHTSIASLPGMKERTILLNGLSKSMAMTGWRIGYMAAPPELIDPLNRMAFYMTAGATSFAQYAAAEALDGDDGSAEKMRLEFKKRRDYLVGEINEMENFSCIAPQGAFYVFMNIKKTGMKSEEFCDYALEQYRLAMMPGDVFGQCGEGFVRLSYAASRQVLEEAVCILKDIDHEISQKMV